MERLREIPKSHLSLFSHEVPREDRIQGLRIRIICPRDNTKTNVCRGWQDQVEGGTGLEYFWLDLDVNGSQKEPQRHPR